MRDEILPDQPANGDSRFPVRRDNNGPDHRLALLNPGQSILPQLADNQTGAAQNEIDLLAYWQLLIKRRWLIVGIISVVVSLVLIQTLLTTPTYRATAVIQIEKETIQVVDVHGMQQADV